MKKFKVAEIKSESVADRNPNRKLMSTGSNYNYNATNAYPARTLSSPSEQLFIKQEPNEASAPENPNSSKLANSAIRYKSNDPFSFDDGGLSIDTFKRAPSPLNKVRRRQSC